MRLLVLGGTGFVGGTVAREAVQRGHDVTCTARGVTGSPPGGVRLVRIDRDAPGALEPLAGAEFDAVVDVATGSHPWVAEAVRTLGPRAGHWTYVSTINVYADTATPGQSPGSELRTPLYDTANTSDGDPGAYGRVNVASEDEVRDKLGDRAFVVRPGLITGPGDTMDRFGYWPARFARGGRVLVPDTPEQPIQYIDVRDLAAWIVDAATTGRTGTFDGIGQSMALRDLLEGIAAAVGEPVEMVAVPAEDLERAGVDPWSGPHSLPLWLPPSHYGLASHDARPSLEAGLRPRSLHDAALGALEHERALGLDRPRQAGLSPEEERAVLEMLERSS
ncbi:NAD-dependent epimerase/dehydratase family protein [Haloechinothrix sp. YIM 98757]|uniref:NAD-dependent epimerase/dehydratase family protein n=1 Tax=Haloechinothrix aidingensis TaxID=2752311 RepID=A0A838AEH2_9PSEU|nr:NAD-dependent epimerase/dehydratase family protein [Haloechinothrix aidingensis]MBA0127528.1 NAD-dependent epimerase/dehydratase family protein [Haloechinothrix aidingensis]